MTERERLDMVYDRLCRQQYENSLLAQTEVTQNIALRIKEERALVLKAMSKVGVEYVI